MAKTLTSNVYLHGDPETGEGAGWVGPDYPDRELTADEAKSLPDAAFEDDGEDDEVPGPGQTRADLQVLKDREADEKKSSRSSSKKEEAPSGNQ